MTGRRAKTKGGRGEAPLAARRSCFVRYFDNANIAGAPCETTTPPSHSRNLRTSEPSANPPRTRGSERGRLW
jgi:hypothetical protein